MTIARRMRFGAAVPALAAAFPATQVWTANYDEIAGIDAAVTIVLLFAVGALLYGAIRWSTRRRMGSSTSAVIAALVNAALFMVVLVAERLPLRFRYAVGIQVVIAAGAVAWLWYRGGHRPGILRATALIVVASYASLLAQLAPVMWHRRRELERVRGTEPFAAPISSATSPEGERPDIYLLVLDTYGSPEVLRAVYGVDDSPFRDSLRAMGFRIPVTHANYPITAMALASLLNADYLDALSPILDGEEPTLAPFYALIHDDRVTRFLASKGYRSYIVPSVPWAGTLIHDRAVVHLTTPRVGILRGLWLRSALISTTWPHTLIGALVPRRVGWSTREKVMAAFDGTRELIDAPGPKFVLMHSMAAHFPFTVDRDCRPLPEPILEPELQSERSRDAYADGIRCTDREVLSLVRSIVQRSKVPPVILLQGDHGPRGLGLPWTGSAAAITTPQARGRFGTLGAYYLPGHHAVLPDTMTPVNVMRAMLSRYLGADLPPLPDRSVHATMDRPYHFFAIPQAMLRDTSALVPYALSPGERNGPKDP